MDTRRILCTLCCLAACAGTLPAVPVDTADSSRTGVGASERSSDPDVVPRPDPPAFAATRYSLPFLAAYRKSMEIEREVLAACEKYSVPPALARAVLLYESGGNEGLVSGAGARGYFQVMPPTFRLMGVATNIEAGVKYLSQLLREFGREDDALAAYNGGPGRLKRGRPLPIETLQYVVGVGIFRTLLATEEEAVRAEASRLEIIRAASGDTWAALSGRTGIPVLELRLYNAFLALRPLKAGMLIAVPRSSEGAIVLSDEDGWTRYVTRRGDNYLLLAFAFGLDLEQFRQENALWRVQVPFEGMRLAIRVPPSELPPPEASAGMAAPDPAQAALATAAATPAGRIDEPSATVPASRSSADSPRPAAAAPGGGASEEREERRHTVRRGETLYALARRYGVSVDEIQATNRLRGTSLQAGQVLRIPAN